MSKHALHKQRPSDQVDRQGLESWQESPRPVVCSTERTKSVRKSGELAGTRCQEPRCTENTEKEPMKANAVYREKHVLLESFAKEWEVLFPGSIKGWQRT